MSRCSPTYVGRNMTSKISIRGGGWVPGKRLGPCIRELCTGPAVNQNGGSLSSISTIMSTNLDLVLGMT